MNTVNISSNPLRIVVNDGQTGVQQPSTVIKKHMKSDNFGEILAQIDLVKHHLYFSYIKLVYCCILYIIIYVRNNIHNYPYFTGAKWINQSERVLKTTDQSERVSKRTH